MTTVIWIDWYSYHISRFRALFDHHSFQRQVTGIELVGGCGVHEGLKFRDAQRDGLPISALFPDGDWNKIGQLKLAIAVWRKLDELRPLAVLVPGWYTAPALAAALWAKFHRKRSILMTETTAQDHLRLWWKEQIKSAIIRSLFDFGIAGGKPHVRYLIQLGFPPSQIARCYDVVDNLFYQKASDAARKNTELRQVCGLPEHYFLYIGRLAPEKNVNFCLRAFARYREMGGAWSLVLVGDGPDRNALEQQSHDLGISEHTFFEGLRNTKETSIYYAFADCFVLPSTREPWGLVVNEAMASGLPVLVSDRCGCAEDLVEPAGNGYLFDPSNQSDLTNHLLTISAASKEALDAMGRRSREIIAEYSPERWASEVARVVGSGSVLCES